MSRVARSLVMRMLGVVALAGLVCVGGGFAWFAHAAARQTPWPAPADGIVVLTGGAQRVETGLALLDAGVADRLLISGVPAGIALPAIVERMGSGIAAPPGDDATAGIRRIAARSRDGRVTIGHGADSTIGNAVETAYWVRANGLRSIVVVTAGYHMARALAEIAAAAPGVAVEPFAVHPPGVGLRILGAEYVKFLAVCLGLARAPRVVATT